MTERVKVKRLYFLGQFNNLEVENEVTDIPSEIINNPKTRGLLSMVLLLSVEKTYRRYLQMQHNLNQLPAGENLGEKLQDAINVIEEVESHTYNELLELISPNKEAKQLPK